MVPIPNPIDLVRPCARVGVDGPLMLMLTGWDPRLSKVTGEGGQAILIPWWRWDEGQG